MSDPRYTDPDPRLSDPVRRRESTGGMWGWIAGVAVLLLIGFVLVAGWNSNPDTASNSSSAPVTTGNNAPRAPASTTGSGTTSPRPMQPAPAAPSAPQAPRGQ